MKRTWKPTTAGILTIIAGAVQILVGLGSLREHELARRFMPQRPILGLFLLLLGIVSIIGGVFALNRKVWGMALAGAVCSLLPPHIAVLGILSIIFVALGKNEFSAPKTPPPAVPPANPA